MSIHYMHMVYLTHVHVNVFFYQKNLQIFFHNLKTHKQMVSHRYGSFYVFSNFLTSQIIFHIQETDREMVFHQCELVNDLQVYIWL